MVLGKMKVSYMSQNEQAGVEGLSRSNPQIIAFPWMHIATLFFHFDAKDREERRCLMLMKV